MSIERLGKIIRCQTVSGSSVTVGDVTLTPQSQALTIRWPYGGLVWNRPIAILVERGQQVERVPIVDVTRMLQLVLLGLGVTLGLIRFALKNRHRRDQNG
jgi:hypothetical protein